ncbi:MMPL family transporter, partial [Myxococcota bacterium]|nr:MMPL family transporter [Myxococcota bacterium]
VMTTAGIYSARNLGLDADLSELLPKTFPSVEGLEELKKRFGGIGFVVVVGQSKDPKALRQFADDLAPKLEKLPDVRWVDYKRPTQFIEDHILYFIDTPDLQKLSDQLAARMEYERRSRNPLYLDFEDDGPPEFSLDELGNKYSGKSDSSWLEAQLVDEYYADDERGMVLLLVKPGSMSIDLDYAKKVVDQVKAETARLDMTPYGEDFKVGWAGTYVKKVDQQELIQSDLQLATWVAFALMLLYLAFHFRRITAVFLIVIPLSMGLVWTYAFAAIVFVKLNILTGFIGAILLGLGIDHGIHLLGRYEHEFGFAKTPLEAIQKAFSSTGRAVSMAALTTLVAFAGLGMSEFVAFREFGVIAAAGMVLVVAAYMLTLPALLALADKYGWKPASGKKHLVAPVFAPLGKFAVPVMAVSLAIFAILTMLVPTAHFNHDAQSLAASQLPSFDLDLETNEILGYSQTP